MTPERDTATRLSDDLKSAFGLLSRLPVPRTDHHRADAAWAWPLVGSVVGSLAAGAGWTALFLGLPAGVAAAVVLFVGTVVTGALHEDGLADTADGLFGGWTPERRLEIMKDSHIGSYGTLALILGLLAKWSALATILPLGGWGAVIAAAALSRAPMALIMAVLPNPRHNGLSKTVGQPSVRIALIAAAISGLIALPLGLVAGAMALAAAGAALVVAVTARAKIGGQTGDILGASQQLAELAALCAAAALLQ